MARLRGIKARHPLGSVPTRSGVSQLTVVPAASSATASGSGVKISELPEASQANLADQLEANQSGTTRRITLDQVGAAVVNSDALQDAIGAAAPPSSESVASLAALKALATRPLMIVTRGYFAANDGGGGPPWQWVVGSTATADDFMVVSPAGTPTGRYIRQLQAGANVSPKWAGCGLGAADDSAQFQKVINFGAAIDASGGSYPLLAVTITAATACPGIFSDGTATFIAGPGATSATSMFTVTKSDFSFDRLFFNLPTSTSATVAAAYSTGMRFSGDGRRARVSNCRTVGGGTGCTLQGHWSDVYILNNSFEQTWADGFSVAGGDNVTIEGNTVRDGGFGTAQTSGGIRLGYTATDPLVQNVWVRNNVIQNFALFGQSAIDCYMPGARNIVITGNILDRNGSGIEMKTDLTVLADNVYQSLVVSDNLIRVRDMGAAATSAIAISLAGLSNVPDLKPGKLRITSNVIYLDSPAAAGNGSQGIGIAGCYTDTAISNNYIVGLARGIECAPASTVSLNWSGLVVSSNYISNTVGGNGIHLGGAAGTMTSPRIADNIVSVFSQALFFTATTVNGAIVQGNYLLSTSSSALDIRDTHTSLFSRNTIIANTTTAILISTTPSDTITFSDNDITTLSAGGHTCFDISAGTGMVITNNRTTVTTAGSGSITGAGGYVAAGNRRGLVAASPTGSFGGTLGDIFFNSAPAAAGFGAFICTTAGNAATAVWKGYWAIQA